MKRPPLDPKIAVALYRDDDTLQAQRATVEAWAERTKTQIVSWVTERPPGGIEPAKRPGLLTALNAPWQYGGCTLVAASRRLFDVKIARYCLIERLAQECRTVLVAADEPVPGEKVTYIDGERPAVLTPEQKREIATMQVIYAAIAEYAAAKEAM